MLCLYYCSTLHSTLLSLSSKGKVQEVKKMVMTALSLPWNDDGLFSPVKRNTAGGTHRPARSPLKLILLLGSAPVQSPTVIITPQIRKMLDSMEIQIIHVAEKTHFTSIHFINSNVPLTTVTHLTPRCPKCVKRVLVMIRVVQGGK